VSIETTVIRRGPEPAFPGTLCADQALGLEAAIEAHTVNPAQAMGLAQDTGRRAPGISADFIVLDHNLFDIPWNGFTPPASSRRGSTAVSSTTRRLAAPVGGSSRASVATACSSQSLTTRRRRHAPVTGKAEPLPARYGGMAFGPNLDWRRWWRRCLVELGRQPDRGCERPYRAPVGHT
jgi:hypothetical protein